MNGAVIDWGATVFACICTGYIGMAAGWLIGFRDRKCIEEMGKR